MRFASTTFPAALAACLGRCFDDAASDPGHELPPLPSGTAPGPLSATRTGNGGSRRTRVLLIRHGETLLNVEKRVQGRSDHPLTETGWQQAEDLATSLQADVVDRVFCSPLLRAFETAAIVADRLGVPLELEPDVIERDQGRFEGLGPAELGAPDLQADVEAWDSRREDYEPPGGGESLRSLRERAIEALGRIVDRHPGETVAIITHSNVIETLVQHVEGIAPDGPRIARYANAGVHPLRHSPSQGFSSLAPVQWRAA